MNNIRHLRAFSAALALLIISTSAAWPNAQPLPAKIHVAGQELVLNGAGERILMFIQIYRCALYLPRRSNSIDYINHPNTPAAIRIDVIYDDPPDALPDTWRQTLRAEVSDRMFRRMRNAYADVRSGDVVLFSYAPGHGTSIQINDRTIGTDPGHGLMNTLLEQWIGSRSVSDDLRISLVGDQPDNQ